MCGILGTVNNPFDLTSLELIRHRGPDGQGLTEHECGAHHVHLGHQRLAIVDLSEQGAQPMALEDGSRHIVFNGEIYNHLDIRRDLPGPFRGRSDTATLLAALAASGISVLKSLNGIFGLAYLDIDNRKLFLARDPFGVKPVYYSASPHSFAFASEIAPLRSMVGSEVDPTALPTLLKLRFVPSPCTLFRNIRRLRPGHILELDLGKNTLSWEEYPFIGARTRSRKPDIPFQAALEEYERLFARAVSRQMMADVEVGILLSGGIDSALVAASAQSFCERPLKAFTVGFHGEESEDADEINAARRTAGHLGMEHRVARIGFEDFLDTLKKCVGIVEEPLATTSIVPMHFLAKLAGNHVKVVMSGQGADELLGGYNRYQVELWQRMVPPALARAALPLAEFMGVKNDTVRRGLQALGEPDELSRFLSAYAVFTDEEIVRLTGLSNSHAYHDLAYFHKLLGCRHLPSSVERMMALDARLGLPDDLLLYTDKITMREGLECRVPLLDIEFVSFVQSLPYHYRVKLGRTKIIHSAYAKQRLPSDIVDRPKKGFVSPTRAWFRDDRTLRSILIDHDSSFARFFDLGVVKEIIHAHQRGFNRERQIFLLLCIKFSLDASESMI